MAPSSLDEPQEVKPAGATVLGKRVAEETTDRPPLPRCPSETGQYGVAVGCLAVPYSLLRTVQGLLMPTRWLRAGAGGRQVTPLSLEMGGGKGVAALHLSPPGAAALNAYAAGSTANSTAATAEVPPELAVLIADGSIKWMRGLRPGSSACLPEGRKDPADAGAAAAAAAGGAPTFIELFAGIGGFRIGLCALGWKPVFASELGVEERATYTANCGPEAHPVEGDITCIDTESIPPHDLLTGGFCCQSFSRMGEQAGFDDARGELFFEIVRVLRHHKPRALLLENVANVLDHDEGRSLKLILRELRSAGYCVSYQVINASLLLAQHRQRVYFVGIRSDLKRECELFRCALGRSPPAVASYCRNPNVPHTAAMDPLNGGL
ncbi:hypothetical protein CYMTET_18980 [Cymbomonas tetramitiformis]|uniref:DNA (cytosine-5-)-methyltransferase n=1 Tax=Cymbomonas tetramitiformis TaxID=36881 RepID=A0AAE0G7M0_9CHLO|nr:hypothetical protein CYMTET_18980 [Cymbomonas tetramitiformis]